jgi:hypothetical protein
LIQLENTSGGTASATPAGNLPSFEASSWLAAETLLTLSATSNPGYAFDGWTGSGAGSYNGTLNPETQTVRGPFTELATFTPHSTPAPTTYVVEFQTSSAPPSGITWTVEFNGTPYSSSTGNLSIAGLAAGKYAVSVGTTVSADGGTEWAPSGTPTSVSVPVSAPIPLTFDAAYWVSLSIQGPGTLSGVSAWAHAGAQFTVTATPNAGAQFEGWSGMGAGAYSGNGTALTLTVSGPVSEVASFSSAAPAAATTTNFWATGAGIGLLAVVGISVGLAAAVVLSRRGRRGPPAEWSGETGGAA